MTGVALAFLAFIGPSVLFAAAERVTWRLAPRHPRLYRLFNQGDMQ